MATLLCSYLIGSGFAACVVSGYATREVVLNDQRRVKCPYVPAVVEEEVEEEPEEPNKYRLRDPPDLRSNFLLEAERVKMQLLEQEREKEEMKKRKEVEEQEKPKPDPKFGHRIHAWVAVLTRAPWCYKPRDEGKSQPKEPPVFFIEPSTGFRHETDDPCYLGIESVWNQYNYFVNRQEPITNIKDMRWDLGNSDDWELFLPGEPYELRRDDLPEDQEPLTTEEETEKEKHLDMPLSWVDPLEVSFANYQERFPGGLKVIHFKRFIYERFAPYKNFIGLVKRLTQYDTLEYDKPVKRWEWYENRGDYMEMVINDYANKQIEEYFTKGRKDYLKVHMKNSLADEEHFDFYFTHKFDALKKLVYHSTSIEEYYDLRSDLLYYREYQNDGPNKSLSSKLVVSNL
jgi:hypothetical protein